MTTTTVNRRSNKTLTAYVETVDRMRVLAKQLSDLSKLEVTLRPEVLGQIGERREVIINGTCRILEPETKESIGQVDTEKTTAAFKALGLPVSTRSAEFVAPASFSKYVREGLVPDELIKKTTESIVVVH